MFASRQSQQNRARQMFSHSFMVTIVSYHLWWAPEWRSSANADGVANHPSHGYTD